MEEALDLSFDRLLMMMMMMMMLRIFKNACLSVKTVNINRLYNINILIYSGEENSTGIKIVNSVQICYLRIN